MHLKDMILKRCKELNVTPLYIAIGGSQLYGTNLDTSDFDIIGVFIPNNIFYLLKLNNKKIENVSIPKQKYKNTSVEGHLYSFEKVISLLLSGTPNIVEILFIPDSLSIYSTSLWEQFKKDMLYNILSKKIKHTFSGYAFSQLRRFTSIDIEKTDNKNRLELIKKYGWDTKKEMHVIRLLNEGLELLVEGHITFPRPERDYLKSIRQGGISMEEVIQKAHFLDEQITTAYVDSNSVLLYKPNSEKVYKWYINNVIHSYLCQKEV